MTDIFTAVKRSAIMSAVRGTGNLSTEKRFIKILRENKISGWRRNSKLDGKPDFYFPKLKLAIFLDGCFWHGCPRCKKVSKTRPAFWLAKISTNLNRDVRVNKALTEKGHMVYRIWEHDLRSMKGVEKVTADFSKLLSRRHKVISRLKPVKKRKL